MSDDEIWDRIWERIDYDDDDPGRCWEWQGRTDPKGYGKLFFIRPGRSMLAHRYVYQEIHGPIPKGQQVRHTCDNPPCCNPAHLVLGTPADNQNDMRERGRSRAKHWGQGGVCVNGHPWEGNEYFYPNQRKRICRACKSDEQRRRRAKAP